MQVQKNLNYTSYLSLLVDVRSFVQQQIHYGRVAVSTS